MVMSAAKRAWIAIGILVILAAAGACMLVHRMHRPLPGSSAGPSPNILSLLPPGAPAVAYIDVGALRRLQNSPLAAMLGLVGANPREDRDYENFVRDTGFDYTRDLDRVAIAFWPANSQAAREPADDRAVAIADGRFDGGKIKAYALRTGKVVTSGAGSLYEVPGEPPVAFEFLSPTRIALGSGRDAASLLGASNSSPRDPAMQARIERVAGAPIFAAARTDELPASFYDALRNAPQFESIARSVKGMTLAGKPDGDLIHMTLDAECNSMPNAIELTTLLDGFRMLGSMALADPKTRRQMTKEQAALATAVLTKVKVTHQDRWVRLTLDVTPAMLAADDSNRADPPQK